LELIYGGRSLRTGRPLAAVFDLGGLSSSCRPPWHYRDAPDRQLLEIDKGAFVYGFVRLCGFLYLKKTMKIKIEKTVGRATKKSKKVEPLG
jgi:hypothetical protein